MIHLLETLVLTNALPNLLHYTRRYGGYGISPGTSVKVKVYYLISEQPQDTFNLI